MLAVQIKINAAEPRKSGYSYGEISQKLGISKGTIYLWVNRIPLDDRAIEKLRIKKENALIKANQVLRKKKLNIRENIRKQAGEVVNAVPLDKNIAKLLCSFLFWAEGFKRVDQLRFINSDPNMIRVFLDLLRNSFSIDERKFRVIPHLHDYHNINAQRVFWSEVTAIPLTQFNKTYIKPHTGKRIKPDHPGCVDVRYYDYKVARELQSIYNAFVKTKIGVW